MSVPPRRPTVLRARTARYTRRALLARLGVALGGLTLASALAPSALARPELADPTATATPVPGATLPAEPGAPAAMPVATASPPLTTYSTDLLVDVAWVVDHLADPHLQLFELGEPAPFAAGHLPSAGLVRWEDLNLTDSSAHSVDAWKAATAARLGALGIAADSTVLIYDAATLLGARLWWVLQALGLRDVRILDGGRDAWVADGQPLSTDPPTSVPTTISPSTTITGMATAEYLASRLGAPDLAIVDARTPEEFAGASTSGAVRGGHVPGAINVPFTSVATPQPPRFFLAPRDLANLYASRGVTVDKEVIAYCSTGVRSAVSYFSLRLLGYPRVLLYSASWQEWGNRADLPIES